MQKLKLLWQKYNFSLIYLLLTIAILYPLLKPGYVLTLDMIFGPKIRIIASQSGVLNGLPFMYFLKAINFLIPTWFIQKIILILIFLLSGISMHLFAPTKSLVSKFFAGILYMINPFTYERFLAGQWTILLAYSLVPFALKYFTGFLEDNEKNFKKIAINALWLTFIGMINIHILALLLIAEVILGIFWIIRHIKKQKFLNLIKPFATMALIFLALNIYWILPIFKNTTVINNFNSRDLLAYKTTSDKNFGSFLNVASMYGFWKEDLYNPPKETLPYWYLFSTLIIAISLVGIFSYLKDKKQRDKTLAFVTIYLLSLFMAVGYSSFITKDIFSYLYQNFIFFKGFRDSQKFVALIVLFYAYFGARGIEYLKETWFKNKGRLTLILASSFAIILPLIYTYSVLGGFNGQLKVSQYPKSWYQVNDILNSDNEDFKTLFLPWHMYMVFDFASTQTIANPASLFFDKPIIQGDNVEIKDIYSNFKSQFSEYMRLIIEDQNKVSDLNDRLKEMRIKYIILSNNADFREYDFLYKQPDLEVIYRGNDVLFKNKSF